jgi:hypothetical protein
MSVYTLFLHNWVASVRVSTEWKTTPEVSPTNEVEERQSLVGKPRRTVTVKWTAMTQEEANKLSFTLQRMGHQRLRLPLYPDVSETTATSSLTTINCPTTDRRYYVGQRVVIHDLDTDGRPTNVQWGVIQAVAAGAITLTGALTGSYPAGSVVYPVLDVEIVLAGEATPRTAHTMDLEVAFEEVAETSLPASDDYTGIAGDFDTQEAVYENDRYVLEIGPNWAKQLRLGMARAGSAHELGRGVAVVPRGVRPKSLFSWTCDRTTRAEHALLLRFFDAHRGRAIPFLLVNPLVIWQVVTVATTRIDVQPFGDVTDPNTFNYYVAIKMRDGTLHIRQNYGASLVGGNHRIELNPVLPAMSASEIEWVTSAHLVRFQSDSLDEEWLNNEVA